MICLYTANKQHGNQATLNALAAHRESSCHHCTIHLFLHLAFDMCQKFNYGLGTASGRNELTVCVDLKEREGMDEKRGDGHC